MKKITAEKTKYYEFLFAFDYKLDILEFCRYMKDKHGFRQFGFVPEKKVWGFNTLEIYNEIKSRYNDIVVSQEAKNIFERSELELKADKLLLKNAERIKKADTASIDIKNVKSGLYPYQEIGVEFFVVNFGNLFN